VANNVIPLTPRPQSPRLRSDVIPFDPTNPAHLRAWESIWDLGMMQLKGGR